MAEEIRGAFSKDKELGELKRDLAAALKKVVPLQIKEFNGPYAEPMYLGPFDRKPVGVMLLAAMDARDQEDADAVLTGGFCHCTWEGARKRMRINSIDGLTPSATSLYRFHFLVVG